MRLTDARRLAIKQQLAVRFPLSNGGECVIDHHGLARVPGLTGPTDVSLEQEFGKAQQFSIEETGSVRSVTRAQFEQMTAAGGEAVHAAADHEE